MKPHKRKHHSGGKDLTKCAYKNLALVSMEGEEWKDMPQFDGAYHISNYGRVWATARPVNSITGQSYYTKERIRKAYLNRYQNPYTGNYNEQLSIHLRYEGQSHSYKVNRLVYEFFVAPPGTNMEGLLVIHKDGDSCNNRWDNLVLMDGPQLYRHGLELKRRPRIGLKMTRRQPFMSKKNAPRAVVQYTLEGKKLKEYYSINEAAIDNNTNREGIRKIVQHKAVQLHGLVYRLKDDPYRGEHADFSFEKTVTQYRLDGKKVKAYLSVKEAAAQTGIDTNTISKCALGKIMTCGGFVWRYEGDSYKGEYKDKIRNKAREIVQYKPNGKKVASFPSVNQAAQATGFSPAVLLDCAHKKSKMAHGFVWRFAGEPYRGEYRNYRRGKPVTQHTLEGKRMDTFPTIEVAAQATGLTPDNIQKNVNGHNKTAGGFVWKFATAKEIQKLPDDTTPRRGGGRGKEVIQYSVEGRKLAVYPSITQAAKACDISPTGISSALDNPTRIAAGYVWRTKGNRYWGALSRTPQPNKARMVTQYDLKGRKIEVYQSAREAAVMTGVASSTISMVARGKLKTTGGFIWQYGDAPTKINIKEYFASIAEHTRKISKPVLKYSLEGKLLKEYPSIKEAARKEGIRMTRISAVVNGKSKSAGGNYWKFKAE